MTTSTDSTIAMAKDTASKSFASGFNTPDMKKLKQRHRELLDAVDGLRSNNLDKYVALPQIIVVGGQSSGKSSVLEAISRVDFPSNSKLCTRFATELKLREKSAPHLRVTIRPHSTASEHEKARLGEFVRDSNELDGLPSFIKDATEYMGLGDKKPFSDHTLSIEASGPHMLQLTLIDLPGFYSGGDNVQSAKFRDIPPRIASEYMSQKGSIILKVVSAGASLVHQCVTEETSQHDKTGQRTIGIITKPDLMHPDMEDEILEILRNEPKTELYLRHGWHVVRNRDSRDPPGFEARDRLEAEFFETKPWKDNEDINKGILSLKEKLPQVLIDHIADKLPEVVDRITTLIEQNKSIQKRMPKARTSHVEILAHLNALAGKFETLASQAVQGEVDDDDDDFLAPHPQNPASLAGTTIQAMNLRARVREINGDFVTIMQRCGSRNIFNWTHESNKFSVLTNPETLAEDVAPAAAPPALVKKYKAQQPKVLKQEELEQQINDLARKERGMELPGTLRPGLALKLFHFQSIHWKSLASTYVRFVLQAAEEVVTNVLQRVTEGDKALFNKIRDQFIKKWFRKRKTDLDTKIEELLPAYNKHFYPIALEASFAAAVHSRGNPRVVQQIGEVIVVTNERGNPLPADVIDVIKGNDDLAQSAINVTLGAIKGSEMPRVIENMLEYYEVTLRTFMINVIILGIENQLMVKIPTIFTMDEILKLDDAQVDWIGGESPEIKHEREKVEATLKKLNRGLKICEKWGFGSSSDFPPEVETNGTSKSQNGVNGQEK